MRPHPNPLAAFSLLVGWRQHPRNGKVARLPEHARELINQLLEDGLAYRQVIERLPQAVVLPYPISEMNLSNWVHGGYQDWRRKKLLAEAGLTAEHAAELLSLPRLAPGSPAPSPLPIRPPVPLTAPKCA